MFSDIHLQINIFWGTKRNHNLNLTNINFVLLQTNIKSAYQSYNMYNGDQCNRYLKKEEKKKCKLLLRECAAKH